MKSPSISVDALGRCVAILLGVGFGTAVVGVAAYTSSSPPASFSAELRVVSVGVEYGGNFSGPLVNLSLTYSSRSLLQAANLAFVVVGPVLLWNGSTVQNLSVLFGSNQYPPWMSMPSPHDQWTGYSMTATNPDGSVVDGIAFDGSIPVTNVESGVVFSMSLPDYAKAAGLTVNITYLDHPGSAQVTV
jgi:hypothetical protein